MDQPSLEPFYFGPDANPLFGCYSPPAGSGRRNCGVLICYPFGSEYLLAHRAFYQLACRLSSAGFPVLRFDYSGCGDSAGDTGTGGVGCWLEDISAARAALADRSGTRRVCLVGARLGASLAALAATSRAADAVVLWDSVIRGTDYLEELAEHHRGAFGSFWQWRRYAAGEEVLGYPIPAGLRQAIGAIDLSTLPGLPAPRVLIAESGPRAAAGHLATRWEASGSHVELRQWAIAGPWYDAPDLIRVPEVLLRSIVSWISGECS